MFSTTRPSGPARADKAIKSSDVKGVKDTAKHTQHADRASLSNQRGQRNRLNVFVAEFRRVETPTGAANRVRNRESLTVGGHLPDQALACAQPCADWIGAPAPVWPARSTDPRPIAR